MSGPAVLPVIYRGVCARGEEKAMDEERDEDANNGSDGRAEERRDNRRKDDDDVSEGSKAREIKEDKGGLYEEREREREEEDKKYKAREWKIADAPTSEED